MPVDLHTHSRASDGSDTPAELVRAAAAARLGSIALTDHDTVEGIAEALEIADQVGIELIPGTEISCEWSPGGMHMVILWLEPTSGPLQDQLHRLQDGRNNRNSRIVEKLQGLGLDVSLAEIEEEAGAGSVGRPHIAAVLVRKGYVPDIATAFDEFLATGRPAYLERDRLTPEEAIMLARQSDALPVLAHPHTLGIEDEEALSELLGRLAGFGLVGLECHYGAYQLEERKHFESLARRNGLIPSGGSDYHGSYKEGIALGTGRGDLNVQTSVLDELRAARAGTV